MAVEIAIVGAGRAGQTIGRSLRQHGFRIGPVVTRSLRSARSATRFIGAGEACSHVPENTFRADVILVAVPDPQIRNMAQSLTGFGQAACRERVFLHMSGSRGAQELDPLRRLGAHCGSLHPLLPLPWLLPSLPKPIFFAVEGDSKARFWGARLARRAGGVPIEIKTRHKTLYHAAAALVGGHLMTVAELGARMLMRAGVPTKRARRMILSPIPSTLRQYARLGEKAWTGPVARGDRETVSKHLAAFEKLAPYFAEVYRVVGRASIKVFGDDMSAEHRLVERLLRSDGKSNF
jgi:predicted short-subunit dehydrogenase-like oxidoreductase (DUF2520 family)